MAHYRKSGFLMAIMLVLALLTGAAGQAAAAEAARSVTVTIMGADGKVLSEKKAEIAGSETAFDALVKSEGAGNVKYQQFDFGKMITEISGLAAKDNYYWSFYVNNISAQTGADSYRALDGDALTFRYESAPPSEKVSLEIAGKEKKEFKEIYFLGKPNALQLLMAAAGPENVKYVQYDFGKMISSIFGQEATDKSFWSFYVDGKPQMVGAESFTLEADKAIAFKYETFAPPAEEPEKPEPGKGAIPYPASSIAKDLNETIAFVQKKGQISDWEAIALKKAGKQVPASYLGNLGKLVAERGGKFRNITDYERYTLGILAAGGNPERFAGYNLVEGVYNGDFSRQGLNGAAYALIALDSSSFTVPAGAKLTREGLVAHLAENQGADGGWGFDKEAGSDLDTTSMVLTALAPYKEQEQVKNAISKALAYLADQFASGKADNSPAAAQAVIALSSLGLDANSSLITAGGKTLLGYLASFKQEGGGFSWKAGDEEDALSTAQGIQALVAYQLYKDGKGSLYSLPMADETVDPAPVNGGGDAPADKQDEGHRLPDTAAGSYTWMLIGILLVLSGGGALYFRKNA